jgi:hypothetical protein
MSKRLRLPVENNSIEREGEGRTFTVGELAFPGVSNPTGHLLDALKRGRL